MESNTITVQLKLKMITDISWLDALKLRLAGGSYIRKHIENRFKKMEIKEK